MFLFLSNACLRYFSQNNHNTNLSQLFGDDITKYIIDTIRIQKNPETITLKRYIYITFKFPSPRKNISQFSYDNYLFFKSQRKSDRGFWESWKVLYTFLWNENCYDAWIEQHCAHLTLQRSLYRVCSHIF